MRIIDLSLPIHPDMWVYPGDPKVEIEMAATFEKDGWNMRRIHINGHDGTHVNVPIHGTPDGKNLDDYTLDDFIGESVLFESFDDIHEGQGTIFHDQDITQEIAEEIVKRRPKFVGLSSQFEFNIDVEKYLLEQGVISFERLANTDQLPKSFFFHGAPLSIRAGDGSPVRAYGVAGT